MSELQLLRVGGDGTPAARHDDTITTNPIQFMILAGVFFVVVSAWAVQRFQILPTSIAFWFMSARPSRTETMRAVAYDKHGQDVSVLQIRNDYPKPVLRKNQVLIRVHYSSLNPCDFKFRRNSILALFVPKPKIPGCDLAGIIVDSGTSSHYAIGDRVAALLPFVGNRWGTAADFVAVDESFLARVGPRTPLDQAAAIPLVGLTVLQALEPVLHAHKKQQESSRWRKHDDDNDKSTKTTSDPDDHHGTKKILIQAGAGGVGSFAINYAKHVLGMYVVATASSQKTRQLKQLGCDEVIDYRTVAFEQVVHDMDVVLDPMSWLYQDRTLNNNRRGSRLLKPGGHYVNIQSSDWSFSGGRETVNMACTLRNFLTYKLAAMLPWKKNALQYHVAGVEPNGPQLQRILDWVDNGTMKFQLVDRIFPFEKVWDAYEYLEQGHATGKVLLDHGQSEESSEFGLQVV